MDFAGESAQNCAVLDSITAVGGAHNGQFILAASHAGAYCGALAVRAGLKAVILHDAGVGLDRAGVAGLAILDAANIPAAAISHRSARIGDGADCLHRGALSFCNAVADAAGLKPGMKAAEAAAILAGRESGQPVVSTQSLPSEARRLWRDPLTGAPIWLLDSNSLVKASDRNAIIITGSHGGLLGGRPETAVKAPVFAAAYNDAGVGIDNAGISRLAALEERGIAGVTVAAASARVGDARSTLEDGIVSHINAIAAGFGAKIDMPMRVCAQLLAAAWLQKSGRDRL